MFEKYDPGFLAAFIGVVTTFIFTFIFQQIKIIYRFSERLKILEDRVGTDYGVLPSDLVQLVKNAKDMVREGRNVPRFHLIKRYRKSKRMAKLILDIKEKLPVKIVIHPDPASNLAANPQMVVAAHMDAVEQTTIAEETGLRQRVGARQMVAHMGAAYISLILRGIWSLIPRRWHIWMLPMAHTDAVEETAAAEEQEVVRTDAVEQTAIDEETGLRQRVGLRQKYVLRAANLNVRCAKCKKEAMKAITRVEGVDSILLDMGQEKIIVTGEVDPSLLVISLREKIRSLDLLSVGPAKEE